LSGIPARFGWLGAARVSDTQSAVSSSGTGHSDSRHSWNDRRLNTASTFAQVSALEADIFRPSRNSIGPFPLESSISPQLDRLEHELTIDETLADSPIKTGNLNQGEMP
jgi:hypothetical protein